MPVSVEYPPELLRQTRDVRRQIALLAIQRLARDARQPAGFHTLADRKTLDAALAEIERIAGEAL